jgi:hypothetical protein
MLFTRLTHRGLLAMLTAGLLTACAQHGAMIPASPFAPGFAGGPAQRIALPDKTPPACKGQTDTKDYSKLTVTLSTKGGKFCIPEYGGFGGSVQYPSANPSVKLTLTSSTKDYNHLPQLGKGTAIFYLQLALSAGTDFGTNHVAGGGLTSAKLVAGKAYTAFGEAVIDSIPFNFTPCYAIATKGPYGGVIGGLGTLLKGDDVPSKATGFIEVYSGKDASGKC